MGQVGDDHLAPRALRLQLERQLAKIVLVVAAVGLVGRLAAAPPQPERPVGGLRDGHHQPARLVRVQVRVRVRVV